MSRAAAFRPDDIFEVLERHGVRYVVIGGLAGGAHRAGWPTLDADIVVDATEENLRALLRALQDLRAEYDTIHRPPIEPNLRLLRSSTGPQLFRTRSGRLDVLKEAGGETFDSLTREAAQLEVHGVRVPCASLPALLRMKRAANRPKDQAAIAKIEAALADRDRESS